MAQLAEDLPECACQNSLSQKLRAGCEVDCAGWAPSNPFEFGQAEQSGPMRRIDERPSVDLVVAAGDDGDASLGTGQDGEAEAVSERLVSLLMTAKPGDGDGNASGIGGVMFRVGRVEKGGHGRGVGDARCLEVEGTVEGGDEDPAFAVLDLVPFFVGLQDGGEDMVA